MEATRDLLQWGTTSMLCGAQVVSRYTEVTGVDWDDRCSTCSSSSSSSDSEFDYYLDRRLRPAAAVRHVGEDFLYASGTPGVAGPAAAAAAFLSPTHRVRSPSAGRPVPGAWPTDDGRRGRRRRRQQTGKRCVIS